MPLKTPHLRGASIALFAAVLASLASLDHPRTGWGINSRLALVFAVIDHGTFSIDAYHAAGPTATGDKAFFEGHYYSDKAIGVGLLALPAYAGLRALGALGDRTPSFRFSNYALRVFAVSIPAAVSVVILWWLFLRAGADPRRALFAVVFVFFGSLWFGLSSAFFAYAPAIACGLIALWLCVTVRPGRLGVRRSFAIGCLVGFAVLCDFTFVLMGMGIATVFLSRVTAGGPAGGLAWERWFRRKPLERSAAALVGGALPLALFAVYTTSIFGQPSIPYEYEDNLLFRNSMNQGFFGVSAPRAATLWFLTFHPYRGLFFWSPVLLPAVVGLLAATRRSGLPRTLGWLGLISTAAYLLFNAGYYMWWGGGVMGPRFLLPAMVALPLGLVEWCRRDRHPACWRAVVVLGGVSILMSAPLSILEPETPAGNTTAGLLAATLDSDLEVPQFVYWRHFFSVRNFWHPETGYRTGRIVSQGAAVVLPAILLAIAVRRTGDRPRGSEPA